MAITKKELGKTADGKTAVLYTMKNENGAEASVCDLGAAWTRMLVPDRNGKFADVLLGYDDAETLAKNPGSLGAVIGRNANRIGNASFTLDGKRYQLAANNGKNNLHSGPDSYSSRLFAAVCCSDETGDAVRFLLESPEGDQGYPGSLSIAVTYMLTAQNELKIAYCVKAGEQDTIANMTCHPYFNLAGHDAGSMLSQKLWIDAEAFTEIDENCLTTGRILPVVNTPFDFRSPKAIGKDIALENHQLHCGGGYDHNFCLNGESGKLRLAAGAEDEASGRAMEVSTTLPGMQLYTGNFLNPEITAKGGAHYQPNGGFALETQYYPNAINVPEWEQPILNAGMQAESLTVYRFFTV